MASQAWVLPGACARVAEHLEASCVNCPVLSWQKLCQWLSEIAAPWITITLSGLTGKPTLGGTQEVEHVLDNEGIGFLIVIIAVATSRVERETLLVENTASEALCDMAQSTF